MSRKPELPTLRKRGGTNELALLISSLLAAGQAAKAQQAPSTDAPNTLDNIVVTAQKREENLQSVPVSIQAFDTRKLQELNVTDFNSVAKFLPSLSFQSFGPGQAQLYVRGVTNGGDGLRVGSLPLVGVYLDEQPVTTIGNSLDVHLYDIARVEALSGPQGTLFGASSMAGTLRIITNKPDPAKFAMGYDVGLNNVAHGGTGGKVEGFVNLPLSDRAAIRLVGFTQRDAGYIDNVKGPPQVFPTSGIPRNNDAVRKNAFNDVQTSGGRAALRIDLDDNWSLTPNVIYQHQVAHGQFAFQPSVGDLKVAQYYPQRNDDRWYQASLTVEGKLANLDLTYSGGYFSRKIDNIADYSDYSYFYDVAYAGGGFGNYFKDNAGKIISPAETTLSFDTFTKQTHELRVSTPKENRVRAVAGVFWQRQTNNTRNAYNVANLADALSVTGQPGTLYLNSQYRTDVDRAAFTEVTADLTSRWAMTLGARIFDYDNSVNGFFGYNATHATGEAMCAQPIVLGPGRPCDNISRKAIGGKYTDKINITYKIDEDKLVYATYSMGFRPGGINRNPARPPYTPDSLINYELGWKTSWFDRTFRLNGALFVEKWQDAQFGIVGLNGITEIINAGRAKIKGIESDFQWLVTDHLTLSGSATYLQAKLTTNSCKYPNANFDCALPGPQGQTNVLLAPSGSRLPVSPRFKGNMTARYQTELGNLPAHVQVSALHQSDVIPDLTVADSQTLGVEPAYTSVDFSFGVAPGSWSAELYVDNAFDKRGEATRFAACKPAVCKTVYVLPILPRTIGIQFGQKF